MEHAYGLDIPQTLDELCHPERIALLVYDMQAGIVARSLDADKVTSNVVNVVKAARKYGFRIFFSRHLSLPNQAAGVSQLRTAMTWQRKDKVQDVMPAFPRGSAQMEIIPEITPLESEVIFDKLGMSFFVGTPLEMALRDCGISAIAIVGVVLEVGIEPTIRHGSDLGFLPVLIADACGSVNEQARQRSLDALTFGGSTTLTDTETICDLFTQGEQ
jgi:biuret amidohydrolase